MDIGSRHTDYRLISSIWRKVVVKPQRVIVVWVLLLGATLPMGESSDATASVSNYDLREVVAFFIASGVEQEGVIARTGWDRTNATTGITYYEFNIDFKNYVQGDLNQAIIPIEGVIGVDEVALEPPGPWEGENASGEVEVPFQLDRDVWKDTPGSECGGHITDWGRAIRQPIKELLATKWYVNSSSIDVNYAVPHCADSASGFTLMLTVVSFSLILLLYRRRRRYV